MVKKEVQCGLIKWLIKEAMFALEAMFDLSLAKIWMILILFVTQKHISLAMKYFLPKSREWHILNEKKFRKFIFHRYLFKELNLNIYF